MSLLESNSPLDCPILTPLVLFILLCAPFEAGRIYPLGALTLIDIDHVSVMKSSVSTTPKRDVITAKLTQNMLAYMGI